jgi:hypothetical protein
MSLEWFWDEWVYRGAEPDYEVSYEDITSSKGRRTQIVVTQTHQTNEVVGLFKMPIVFEVHYTDGSIDKKTEWIEKTTHIVKVPNRENKEIAFVLFDPNSQVLKTVTFEKPFEMLSEQALKAPHMLDRYDAVCSMRNVAADKKRDLLEQVYKANTFHAIKTEIAIQLMDDKASEQIVRMALTDKDVLVRKGIMTGTKNIPTWLMNDFEPMLQDSSYVTIVTALEKLCATFPQNTSKYLDATKGIEGTNGRNVLVKWLEISASQGGDMSYVNDLVKYTSNSYEFVTRTNAMAALRRLNYCDKALVTNCVNACLTNNGRLAGPATETVKYFYAQHKYKKMIAEVINANNATGKDKETMSRLMN